MQQSKKPSPSWLFSRGGMNCLTALKGFDGFLNIYLFYFSNQSKKTCLRVKPYLADKEHGIFATRAPHRPNKFGMSLVRLKRIEDNFSDIDILDGKPLLDIKPYIRRFDSREIVRSIWQDAFTDYVASVRA